MTGIRLSPGPAAASAFQYGTGAGAVVGLVSIGLLYASGALTPVTLGYSLVVLFPIYLVFVAAALSAWLGYDKDSTSLRPVYRKAGRE